MLTYAKIRKVCESMRMASLEYSNVPGSFFISRREGWALSNDDGCIIEFSVPRLFCGVTDKPHLLGYYCVAGEHHV